MRRDPDERLLATARAEVEPEHPVEALLWRCMRQQDTSEPLARALEIYADMFERERLQPWIMAGADDDLIAARTALHVDTVKMFRHLCFNLTMFRDLLDKQRWVNVYEARPNTTREGALFLKKAMLHGVEAIAHVMGAPVELEPGHVLDQAMRDTFFRGLALRDGKLTSAEVTAAHNMLKTSTALAQELAKTKPPGVGDILLRIKHRDMTQPIEVIEVAGEILH